MDRTHLEEEGIRVLPPAYPLGALVLAGLGQWIWPLGLPLWLRIAGILILVGGAVLMGVGLAVQIRRGTDPNPWKDTTTLVTTGLYGRTRNPIYLADLLIQAGVGLAFLPWALPLLPLTWAALRYFVVAKEERFLARRFGEPYLAYCQQTRRWL